jgi:hypothetical protein
MILFASLLLRVIRGKNVWRNIGKHPTIVKVLAKIVKKALIKDESGV